MNFQPVHLPIRPPVKGFTLTELMFALAILTVTLVSIFGLLPIGIKSNQNSSEQTAAASLARSIVADLRATSKQASASPQYAIAFPSSAAILYFGEDCSLQNSPSTARYRVTATIQSASPMDLLNVGITWPAMASSNSAAGMYEVTTAILRK